MITKKNQYLIFVTYIILIIFESIYWIWWEELYINLTLYIVVLLSSFVFITLGTKVKYGSFIFYNVEHFEKKNFWYYFFLLTMSVLSTHSLITIIMLSYFQPEDNVIVNPYSSMPIIASFWLGFLFIQFNKGKFNMKHDLSITSEIRDFYGVILVMILISIIFNYTLIFFIIPFTIYIILPNDFENEVNIYLNFANPPKNYNIVFIITMLLVLFFALQILFPEYFISIIKSNKMTSSLLQLTGYDSIIDSFTQKNMMGNRAGRWPQNIGSSMKQTPSSSPVISPWNSHQPTGSWIPSKRPPSITTQQPTIQLPKDWSGVITPTKTGSIIIESSSAEINGGMSHTAKFETGLGVGAATVTVGGLVGTAAESGNANTSELLQQNPELQSTVENLVNKGILKGPSLEAASPIDRSNIN